MDSDWEFLEATIVKVNRKTGHKETCVYRRPSKDVIKEIKRMVPELKGEKNVFHDLGDYWFVRYDGQPLLLKDLEGFYYIKELLSQNKKDLYVDDLTTTVKGCSVLDKEQAETVKW